MMQPSLLVGLAALALALAEVDKYHRTTPGVTAETLFAGYDNVLPEDLLDKVAEEARLANAWKPSDGGDYLFGKKATYWLRTDNNPTPRSHIEDAVLRLAEYTLPDLYSQRPDHKIVGAEWWVQVRNGNEQIGFHYDKDEAMASDQMRMAHPLISTVTYMSNVGAPTIIFNQTTDGNNEVPDLPEKGYISYPTRNRHITFSGDLMHGVLGTASKSGRVPSGRVTLLINWWDYVPLPPNTHELSDDILKEMGIYKDPSSFKQVEVCTSGDRSATIDKRVALTKTEIPEQAVAKRHFFVMPPDDSFYLWLPRDLSSGVHEVDMSAESALWGNFGVLDLENRNQVGSLFRMKEPKIMVMYDGAGKAGKQFYEDMLNQLGPLCTRYVKQFKVFFAPLSSARDVLGAFGLTESDLPKIAFHDTVTDKKVLMDGFTKDGAAILDFIKAQEGMDLEGKEYLHR